MVVRRKRGWRCAAIGLLLLPALAGCAGFGEGVTRAVMARAEGAESPDTRRCEIEGAPFRGMLPALARQDVQPPIGTQPAAPRSILKVLMIHGIGTHSPGFSGTLAANLSRELGLGVTAPQIKITEVLHPRDDERALGTLTARRFTDAARRRELIFYELTWSRQSDAAKARIAYDGTEVFARQRASFNRIGKAFVNDVAPDPLVYVGAGRDGILTASRQALCWAYSSDWDSFPTTPRVCGGEDDPAFGSRIEPDDIFIITHSLGSRIALDALQTTAAALDEALATMPVAREAKRKLQIHGTAVFMLANQLPLIQAGFAPAPTAGQIQAFCRPDGARFADRLLQQVDIIAFNDPNDLMSYPIPDLFVQEDIDARLCPRVANVTLNVAPVVQAFGLGDFANPLRAHSDYETDARVIALMAGGLGQPETRPVVTERCTWIRTEEALR
jgi:hypothetical protein